MQGNQGQVVVDGVIEVSRDLSWIKTLIKQTENDVSISSFPDN